MAKKMGKLSVTLMKVLKAQGLEGRLSEYRVFGLWGKAVGKVVARHAQPQALRGKKLALVVDSPAWMQQLSLLKPEIIEKLNRGLGREEVREIVLKLGEVALVDSPHEDAPVRASLSAEDRTSIEQVIGEISDPDIRDAIRRVMERDCLSKKQRRR